MTRRRKPNVVILTRRQVLARASKVARDLLGVTREEAFEMLLRGELKGTLADPYLSCYYAMLKR